MCYDAEYHARKQLKDAYHHGSSKEEIQELWKNLLDVERTKYGIDAYDQSYDSFNPDDDIDKEIREPGSYWHIKGFAHPTSFICTNALKPTYSLAEWGFIGGWVKTLQDAYDFKQPINNNLNARSEKMFESRSAFRQAASVRRCIVNFDAYYEHHNQGTTKYPFHVSHVEGRPLYMAGIYNDNVLVDEETGEQIKKRTFAILTCAANEILEKIHNNPEVMERGGPRMLVILDEHQIEEYLQPYPGKGADPALIAQFERDILNLCQPYDEELLKYKSVGKLSGKNYVGNIPAIKDEVTYTKLDYASILS